MKPLIDLHGEPRNWATAAPLYIEALADIPPELLAAAVRHAIASNPYFPKPADLRLSIADELRDHLRRQDDERRMKALPPPVEVQPPTAEDIAHVEAVSARALAAIGARGAALRARYERGREPEFTPAPEKLAAGLAELQARGDIP